MTRPSHIQRIGRHKLYTVRDDQVLVRQNLRETIPALPASWRSWSQWQRFNSEKASSRIWSTWRKGCEGTTSNASTSCQGSCSSRVIAMSTLDARSTSIWGWLHHTDCKVWRRGSNSLGSNNVLQGDRFPYPLTGNLNARGYIQILEDSMVSSAHLLGYINYYFLMDDGEPCHCAGIVSIWKWK